MPAFRAVFAALLAATAFTHAQAVEFGQVLADRSSLGFVSRQMGVPVNGSFRKFAVALAFDPARPAQASARIDVDLASIDTGLKEANDEVVGKAWFDVKNFPTASFVSTAVRPLGSDRYEVAGKLTIKGRTQDLVAPATFRQEGGNGVFDGSFTLKRLDFALGEGIWSDIGTVANEVQVRFHIVAAPRK
ncbi:MAG: polyisoprenoid-binding protein [Rhodocyclaceae bacterium]|nr:polyisoprenoid-binding protein [Rhodocyclaceae bacterium]